MVAVLEHGELPFSLLQLKRLVEELEVEGEEISEKYREIEHRLLGSKVKELIERINDELDGKQYFEISKQRMAYFERPHLFGEDVDEKFSSSIVDIEESGKCYAMGRYAACVISCV
jgi:hypothetical protein